MSEELALANNEGRPMMAGVAGGLSSDPTASVSDAYVVGMYSYRPIGKEHT